MMLKKINSIFCWFKSKKLRAIDVIFIVCLLVCYVAFKAFSINMLLDFNFDVNIKSAYVNLLNKNGDSYIIDDGQSRVLKIKNGEVVWSIGEQIEKPFDQIENITVDGDDENIYVHGICWDESGYLVLNEKINKYDSQGQYLKTIYTADYSGQLERKSKIFNLLHVDGNVEFVRADSEGFEHIILSDESDDFELNIKSRYEFSDAIDLIRDYAISKKTGNIYAADKRGKILVASGQNVSTYQEMGGDVYLSDVAVGSDESIYFVDLKAASIGRIYPNHDVKEMVNAKSLNISEGSIVTVKVKNVTLEDGSQADAISTILGDNLAYATTVDGKILYNSSCFKQNLIYFLCEMAAYVSLAVCVISLAYLFIRFVFIFAFNKFELSKLIQFEIIIVVTALLMSIAILPFTGPVIEDVFEKDLSDKLISISKIASKTLSPEKILSVKDAHDYMNDEYKSLVEQLQVISSGSEYLDSRMGAGIETFIDGVAVMTIYQDLIWGSYCPLDYEERQSLEWVYENKQPKIAITNSFEGSYISAVSPIFDADGNVVASVSIDKSLFHIQQQIDDINVKVASKVMAMIFFAIFIVNEVVAFLGAKSRYRQKSKNSSCGEVVLPTHILRLANVAFSISINLSSIFLPIYTLSFYSEELGIPKMLAGSIPISINLMFTTIAPIISLKLFKKFGFKKLIIFGAICSISSNMLLFIAKSYYLMVFALLVNGLGFGLLINSKRNYLVSLDEQSKEEGSIECLSGRNSGVFIGTIVGAFLYSFLDYGQVFLSAAFVDLVSLIFCILLCKTYVAPKVEKIEQSHRTSILKFLLSKRVLVFMAFIVVVWGIISGFSDYYIPIYGNMADLYEEQTSLLMAATSLASVFFGTHITALAIKKFKKNAIYFAMILSFAAMMLLASFNDLNIFTVGLLVLGVAYSFGGHVASNMILGMDVAKKFDSQKILSVFDLCLGLGAVIGPMLFGMMVEYGLNSSIWIFVGVCALLVAAYRLFFQRKRNA